MDSWTGVPFSLAEPAPFDSGSLVREGRHSPPVSAQSCAAVGQVDRPYPSPYSGIMWYSNANFAAKPQAEMGRKRAVLSRSTHKMHSPFILSLSADAAGQGGEEK